jgi:hypothetical protein
VKSCADPMESGVGCFLWHGKPPDPPGCPPSLPAAPLFVYTMAVNERARALYTKLGFVVEREESSAHAKGRGGCLDGVEAAGRVVLLKAPAAVPSPSLVA